MTVAGLVHLGLLYDEIDDLVAHALPEIRTVLDGGGDVRVTVERRGVRELRHALGDDADRVSFPTPATAYSATVPGYLAAMRRELPRDRRTLIVGQYQAVPPEQWDSAHAEDSVNLLLSDLPLTVLCACPNRGAPDDRALTERAHPHLLGASGRVANEAFRLPDTSSPASLAAWGPPAASITVSDAAGLAELRVRTAAVAERAGLGREVRDTAVLAAHEAVLLAASDDPDRVVPLGGEVVVDIRVAHGAVVTEVVAHPSGVSAREGDGRPHWRHDLLARFCDRLAVHHGDEGRRVRVVTSSR